MSQIAATLSKIRLAASSMSGQVRDMGSRFIWIMLVVALAEFLPWMLFLSGIVFSPECPSDNLPALLLAYMIACFAGYPLSIRGPIDRKIDLRGQTILGCVLVAAGIALAYVGGTTTLPTLGLQIAGVILCALGKDQLMGRWYPHFSRTTASMTVCITSCGGVLLAIAYVILMHMANPVRIVLVIAAYLVVPLIASTQVRDYAPLGRRWIDSHAAAEAFALQSRKSIIVLMVSISTIFGYFSMMVASSGFFLQPDLDFGRATALLALCAGGLILIGLVAALSSKNITSVLLNIACTCLIIGAFALGNGSLHLLGVAFMVFGFVITDQFYCAFYCALCHLKKLRDSGADHILRFSHKFIPLGISLGGVLRLVVERYASGFELEASFALGCILFVAFLRVHAREISSTRKEAASKNYSAISLEDIQRFSEAHSAEYGLSDRECEIIHCFMNGRSVRATAQELFISENTVKSHVATIYRKLGVHKREELISLVSKGIKE